MPYRHCNKCHHEWEGGKDDEICDWCGGDSYILEDETPVEKMIKNIKEILPIMGLLADENTVQIQGGFEYTNTAIDKLDSTTYTLGTLVIDVTGSLCGWEDELKMIATRIVEKLKGEDTAKNILWRVIIFSSSIGVRELHGFRLLQDIDPVRDYPELICGGMTNLFDATGSAIEATLVEGRRLYDEELDVNAITVLLTDGDENDSRKIKTAAEIKEKTDAAIRGEQVESYRTILVGVNTGDKTSWATHVTKKLNDFKDEAGLTEYIDMKDFDEKAIKKIILQVSSITSDTSKQLGSGGPSQMTF